MRVVAKNISHPKRIEALNTWINDLHRWKDFELHIISDLDENGREVAKLAVQLVKQHYAKDSTAPGHQASVQWNSVDPLTLLVLRS